MTPPEGGRGQRRLEGDGRLLGAGGSGLRPDQDHHGLSHRLQVVNGERADGSLNSQGLALDHLALQQVGQPQKPGDGRRGRLSIDLFGPAHLERPAALHHHHPVGQRERLLLVMGDCHRRHPNPLEQGA